MRFSESIMVRRPPADVFAYVSDFVRHGEWSGHALQVTQDGDGPVEVGTSFATIAKQFGTQRERSTIVQMDAPATFAWESTGGLGRIRHWFALSDDPAGTAVTKGLEVLEPKLILKLMRFRLKKDMPKALRADLDKIKATLER